eukprot:TRINITY_DN5642_c0_g1_i1.p1 TRINITY_DN5642_c0_g1~~TRINITY_DN5642_c0_g1_i1.p1  ORF type:complete len:268 (+),score=-6.32 TRINITY_DN5642_c0_g1_i1:89-892(+)
MTQSLKITRTTSQCGPSGLQFDEQKENDMLIVPQKNRSGIYNRPTVLPHFQQIQHWDCGITCLRMVLAAYGRRFTTDQLQRICGTKSIWTVDLANILFQVGVPFTFYTVTLGIRPEYASEAFYHAMDDDRQRVNNLFEMLISVDHGVLVQRRVANQDLVDLVSRRYFVIALVDANLLPCDVCGHVLAREEVPVRKAYCGHYVVLCEYDNQTDQFYFLDPRAYHPGYCRVPTKALESARKAFGTDEDLIAVPDPRTCYVSSDGRGSET